MAKKTKPPDKSNPEKEMYPDTPEGWQKRWQKEITAARTALRDWHRRGERIVSRYKGDWSGSSSSKDEKHLPLFTSNCQILEAMLYGKTPKVSVERRFGDSKDQVARVAGVMLERLLNTDIESGADHYVAGMRNALSDYLKPGFGDMKLRYVAEFEPSEPSEAILDDDGAELAPAVPSEDAKANERIEVEYVHWKDELWSAGARTYEELRWRSYVAYMDREALIEAFGPEDGKAIPLATNKDKGADMEDRKKADPWRRAEVHEVWDKEHKCVWFWVEGYKRILVPASLADKAAANGSIPDPLDLVDFWPSPRPMVANLTTESYIPTPDYILHQDLYDEIDLLTSRIDLIEQAVKVAGVYDSSSIGVQRLLQEGTGNVLIPVDKWAMLKEKGGLAGVIDWMPIEMLVEALGVLEVQRKSKIELLFQVTGMSDIMRGQATTHATATEQKIKAGFASVRVERLQDVFAEFASSVQQIKAQLICKFFDPRTIIERSNIVLTQDAQLAEQAAQFLKDNHWQYRIEVKPESVNMADKAALRDEDAEIVSGLSALYGNLVPFIQMSGPPGISFVSDLAEWFIARRKGGASVEPLFERFRQATAQFQQQQAQRPPQPDPKLMAAQAKGQMDTQRIGMEHQADMQRIQAESHGAIMEHVVKSQGVIAETRAKGAAEIAKAAASVKPPEVH